MEFHSFEQAKDHWPMTGVMLGVCPSLDDEKPIQFDAEQAPRIFKARVWHTRAIHIALSEFGRLKVRCCKHEQVRWRARCYNVFNQFFDNKTYRIETSWYVTDAGEDDFSTQGLVEAQIFLREDQ